MLYLDSSAIVKLVVREPQTDELVRMVREDPALVSSALAVTEVVRAVVRAGRKTERAEVVLRGLALVPLDDGILRSAAMLKPPTLRTLDAIHLATALSLGGDLTRLVTYDERLTAAASGGGIVVVAPGGQPSR